MQGTPPVYSLVTDQKDLKDAAADLDAETAIGVDLEADSLFHYREKVCLIQISTPSKNILVDTLALDDLSPLSKVFRDPHIRKIFHGADYDIRSLYRDFNIEVGALFDTQIAARFVGARETGLASLLKEYLGVIAEKKYQKRDWSQRPLPAAMLAYGVQDTCHLLSLCRMFEKELRDKGRLTFVEEECELLSKVRPNAATGDPLFLKFKGAGRLDARDLAVLESILQLRDELARKRDRPSFKVLGNAPIMGMVERKPTTEKALGEIRGMSARQVRILGRSLLERIAEGLAFDEDQLLAFPRKNRQRIGVRASRRIKALKQWRDERARELNLDPSLIFTTAQVQSIALVHPRREEDLEVIDSLRVWQKDLFGRGICDLMKGMD
jgi:ribonuclease D